MIIRTAKTNRTESDYMAQNRLRHIIRAADEKYNVDDVIYFQCYEDCEPIEHINNSYAYVVTLTQDYLSAPIAKGAQIISIRRMV